MSIKAAGKEYKAFIEQLSSQLSSDVARLIKELKTQAEEAVREAEKFDKIRADFSGTVQKIESSTVKAQGKKDAMATFQHINGVMEDFEANKVPYIEAAGNALVNHVLSPVLVSWSSSLSELLLRCKTRLEVLDDAYLKTCRVMDWEGVYRIRDVLDAHGMGLLMPFAPPSFLTPEVLRGGSSRHSVGTGGNDRQSLDSDVASQVVSQGSAAGDRQPQPPHLQPHVQQHQPPSSSLEPQQLQLQPQSHQQHQQQQQHIQLHQQFQQQQQPQPQPLPHVQPQQQHHQQQHQQQQHQQQQHQQQQHQQQQHQQQQHQQQPQPLQQQQKQQPVQPSSTPHQMPPPPNQPPQSHSLQTSANMTDSLASIELSQPLSASNAPTHTHTPASAAVGSLCRPPNAASKSDFEGWWKSGVLVWKLKGTYSMEFSEAAFLTAVAASGTLCVFAHSSGSATGTFKAYVFARGVGAFDGQAAVAEVSITNSKKSVNVSCRATHSGLQGDFTSTLQMLLVGLGIQLPP